MPGYKKTAASGGSQSEMLLVAVGSTCPGSTLQLGYCFWFSKAMPVLIKDSPTSRPALSAEGLVS
jgi:hypothetical protein